MDHNTAWQLIQNLILAEIVLQLKKNGTDIFDRVSLVNNACQSKLCKLR